MTITVSEALVGLLQLTRAADTELAASDRVNREKSKTDLAGWGFDTDSMEDNLRHYDEEIAMRERGAELAGAILDRIDQQAVTA